MAGISSLPVVDDAVLAARVDRARASMRDRGVDVLLLSVGADLPYLTGYEAMPLERLTMLVLPADGPASLVIPGLEVARVTPRPELFSIEGWGETDDPVALVAKLAGGASTAAIGDRTWSTFLVGLLSEMPGARFVRASEVMAPLRMAKDAAEIAELAAAGAAADRVAAALHRGEIALVGRTEADVSAELSRRLIAEGHDKVNFAIVAAGANAASPHHSAGSTVIQAGDIVLCDFGGTMRGYCSDITRCVIAGGREPSSEVAEAYAVLFDAQAAAVSAAVVGTPCEDVDGAARSRITSAGYGELFIHRTGHGIGLEEHEEPYMVSGNALPLAAGYAFSVEPGIYAPGRFGMRLEDIVVATADGPLPMNRADHALVTVDA
jgi:Xaa-Pro aminopeptidase